jgi:hypothetical protein
MFIKTSTRQTGKSCPKDRAPAITAGIDGSRQAANSKSAASGYRTRSITVATSAATATAATATVTATATTAARSFFARTGLVDGQSASLPFLAIESLDGRVGAFLGGHGHESETAGLSGHSILHQVGLGDRTMWSEKIVQIVFGGVEGEIPDVQFRVHNVFRFRPLILPRLFPTIGFQIITEARSTDNLPCLEID